MTKLAPSFTACAALILLGVGLASPANAAYTFTDLGTLGGDFSNANAINNAGQVVGLSPSDIPYLYSYHATLWNGTTVTDLGTPGERYSRASAINDFSQAAGQVVGDDWSYHATVWNGTTVTDLGSGAAYAINNAGQVAGVSSGGATIWNGTTATYLGVPLSTAIAINDAGQAVGEAYTTGNVAAHATLWNGTTATDLGTLGGDVSNANAINNAGQVVGWSATTDNTWHAALWNGGTVTDLNSERSPDVMQWNPGQPSACTPCPGFRPSACIRATALRHRLSWQAACITIG